MKQRNFMGLVSTMVLVACVASASSQSSTIHSRSSLSVASSANMERIGIRNGLSRDDIMFMKDMAKGNRAEAQLGELAQRNGGSWGRGFGKDMSREHGLALEELKKLAARKGVELPSAVPQKVKRAYSMLSRLHGDAFDNAYRKMMIADHREDLAKVQDEMKNGHDSMTRSYAVVMETAVKMHLKMALSQTTMMGG